MKLKTQLRSKQIISVLMLFLTFTLCGQEVREKLGAFTEVKTFNGVEVEVIPSEENRIEITGHSKNDVKFDVAGDRLEIRLSLENIWSKDNTKITVYGSTIETIDANEGSSVEVAGTLEGDELTLRVQEGANLNVKVSSRKIVSKAITGGRITIQGKAVEQEVEINTGGHYYGKSLKTKETEVSSVTAGKGEIYATEYVRATAKLGGTIEIFGRPKEVDQKTSLGGKIL